jgi:hypothetical protein
MLASDANVQFAQVAFVSILSLRLHCKREPRYSVLVYPISLAAQYFFFSPFASSLFASGRINGVDQKSSLNQAFQSKQSLYREKGKKKVQQWK